MLAEFGLYQTRWPVLRVWPVSDEMACIVSLAYIRRDGLYCEFGLYQTRWPVLRVGPVSDEMACIVSLACIRRVGM